MDDGIYLLLCLMFLRYKIVGPLRVRSIVVVVVVPVVVSIVAVAVLAVDDAIYVLCYVVLEEMNSNINDYSCHLCNLYIL